MNEDSDPLVNDFNTDTTAPPLGTDSNHTFSSATAGTEVTQSSPLMQFEPHQVWQMGAFSQPPSWPWLYEESYLQQTPDLNVFTISGEFSTSQPYVLSGQPQAAVYASQDDMVVGESFEGSMAPVRQSTISEEHGYFSINDQSLASKTCNAQMDMVLSTHADSGSQRPETSETGATDSIGILFCAILSSHIGNSYSRHISNSQAWRACTYLRRNFQAQKVDANPYTTTSGYQSCRLCIPKLFNCFALQQDGMLPIVARIFPKGRTGI